MLFVIDGGKGIHKALRQVFGDRAVIQRCQVHKLRNVRDHLPEARRSYVIKQMRDAYRSKSAAVAKKKLLQLVSWLDSNGEDGAAGSLREGLDETLTVLRLGLPSTLCRTFSTTNAIENLNGTLRRICRNVKRWRGEKMITRWIALGIAEAQKRFRRVKGHDQMPCPHRRASSHDERRPSPWRRRARQRSVRPRRRYANFNSEWGIPLNDDHSVQPRSSHRRIARAAGHSGGSHHLRPGNREAKPSCLRSAARRRRR